MKKRSHKPVTLILALVIFIVGWATKTDALEPTLKWKKEFKYKVKDVDLATETGDVLLPVR